jgi:universal stress protein E
MSRWSRILLASDGVTPDDAALTQALSLARNTKASLEALVVCPPLPKRLDEYAEAYKASLRDRLTDAEAGVRTALGAGAEGVPMPVTVETSDTPGPHIVRRVLASRADLVVKAAQPASDTGGFRAVEMSLLRKCPCPLWLARPIERHRQDMRIAVAIDPLDHQPEAAALNTELLKLASTIAGMCGGTLTVISCWDYTFEEYLLNNPFQRVPHAQVREAVEAARAEHHASLDALLKDAGAEASLELHSLRGQPDKAIPEATEELGVDVLVMGTVARTGVPGFVMGNTAENILHRLRCSLVALKPPGFVSPVQAG